MTDAPVRKTSPRRKPPTPAFTPPAEPEPAPAEPAFVDEALPFDDPEPVTSSSVVEAPIEPDIPAPPMPVLAGTFAIYAQGDGGFHLVVQDPDGAITEKAIPAKFVKMVTGGGFLAQKFQAMFGS